MKGPADIHICPLGSGSKGNCTYIGTPHTGLLVDGGFSAKETLRRLALVDVDPTRIQAILVTHEHGDHVGGVGPLARKLKVPVYATQGTFEGATRLGILPERVTIAPGDRFELGEVMVEAIPTPHDARESVAYAMSWGGRRWAILTDFGFPTRLLMARVRECDLLLLEANHDEALLMGGPYPWPLKQRVRGRYGHLSNGQSVSMVAEVAHPGLQGIALMHLSETNNRPEIPFALTRRRLDSMDAGDIRLWIAPQDRPLEGLELTSL